MSTENLVSYIKQRAEKGEYLIARMDKKVGDPYIFNFMPHTVISVCDGDLDGYCWIKRVE